MNLQSVIVGAEAAECNKIAEGANELKTSCETDLAEAIPALEAAEKALKYVIHLHPPTYSVSYAPSHTLS